MLLLDKAVPRPTINWMGLLEMRLGELASWEYPGITQGFIGNATRWEDQWVFS
jgi:hypothetical protein